MRLWTKIVCRIVRCAFSDGVVTRGVGGCVLDALGFGFAS